MMISPFLSLFLAFQTASEPKFEAQVIDPNISIGYGMAIGDVDGDGKQDILLADKTEIVWYRNGDWKRHIMVANLTVSDNVCIAARDLDGDGKVEVAVGAQWNPGETSDPEKSGAVFYLHRPADPTQKWTPKPLHHEPTTHRMRWIKTDGKAYLIVVPLHGRGNKNGEGEGVKVMAYEFPENPAADWKYEVIDESMHLTHNLDVIDLGTEEGILLGGKEGVRMISVARGKWKNEPMTISGHGGIGELRLGNLSGENRFITTVEPMHGNSLVVYEGANPTSPSTLSNRILLTDKLKEGHALVTGDFLNLGSEQIAIGWRNPNNQQEIGIKLFIPKNGSFSQFEEVWIDQNGMACEDIQAADLDGDGRLDLIASGRSTKNLKIYWNRSQ
ncbi:VCBS repeat-containing protein [Algoriphagus sp. AK58]|uniref:FG-GAP-like repeat-containing protein n=1 Tax=Algoriphagus sp. AK58 TaxID=1406877 RepID=UPI00164F8E49|nr:VCBS repeat-containing protein [Algoriphagus sp. AK58]MBC6368635.1 hypothetical protein [Algoriphagus sp. AK58]